MVLDEDALSNQPLPPPGAMPPDAPPPDAMPPGAPPEGAQGGRAASPEEEKMFEMVARQALTFLTSEDGSEYLLRNAELRGPDVALAAAVQEAIDGVLQAAEAGGVKVTPQVQEAATRVAVGTLAGLMAKGGAVDDPAALVEATLAQIAGGADDGAAV